jgi:hypothetical protein
MAAISSKISATRLTVQLAEKSANLTAFAWR